MTEGKILTNEDICLLLKWKICKKHAVPSWVMPNGKIVPTPPLTTSLDIQEKYIWPWLNKEEWDIELGRTANGESWVHFVNQECKEILHEGYTDPSNLFNMALSELVNI